MQERFPLSPRILPARDPSGGATGRVFVCDDDLIFAEELALGLAGCGFDVMTLAAGLASQDIFDHFRPAVVLLDIFMPPPDGFEVMNQARTGKEQGDIAWVLMSGAGTDLLDVAARFCVARNMRLAGAFQKPLNLNDIVKLCAIHAPGSRP
jgi:DNA-binding response OmpR family regulator